MGVIIVADKIIFHFKNNKQNSHNRLTNDGKITKTITCKLFIVEQSKSYLVVMLIISMLRLFFIGNFFIPSSSMHPTLSTGDFILVNKIAYNVHHPFSSKIWLKIYNPKRGDIIVFNSPINTNINFIKRIVGVPGDIISFTDNQLIISKEAIENYTELKKITTEENGFYKKNIKSTINDTNLINFFNVTVPGNTYFVMGDNQNNSEDSRYWGFLSEEHIIGKAHFIWFSWDKIKHGIRWKKIGIMK